MKNMRFLLKYDTKDDTIKNKCVNKATYSLFFVGSTPAFGTRKDLDYFEVFSFYMDMDYKVVYTDYSFVLTAYLFFIF